MDEGREGKGHPPLKVFENPLYFLEIYASNHVGPPRSFVLSHYTSPTPIQPKIIFSGSFLVYMTMVGKIQSAQMSHSKLHGGDTCD